MAETNKDPARLNIIVSGGVVVALLTMAVTFGSARQELLGISRSVDKIETALTALVAEVGYHRERITRLETRMKIEESETLRRKQLNDKDARLEDYK